MYKIQWKSRIYKINIESIIIHTCDILCIRTYTKMGPMNYISDSCISLSSIA